MEFRTRVEIAPFDSRIDHTKSGLSVGSCFADNIAAKLARAKFRIAANPFGVMFNPVSIADTLLRLERRTPVTRDDLAAVGDLWCNFAFHGSFSHTDPEQALEAMNTALEDGGRALQAADYVIITFGTAWVYALADDPGRVVANCHKFPADMFVRRRLTVNEITARYDDLFEGPLKCKHVIFTVSPVRHIKDGFAENTLSKAVLIEAVHELVGRHANADYFPAFEIVNDELRDYRFYANDMVHPSAMAVEYIWERFGKTVLTERARDAAAAAEKVAAAMEHRALRPETTALAKFRETMAARVASLAILYPEVDFSAEMRYFEIAAGGDL